MVVDAALGGLVVQTTGEGTTGEGTIFRSSGAVFAPIGGRLAMMFASKRAVEQEPILR